MVLNYSACFPDLTPKVAKIIRVCLAVGFVSEVGGVLCEKIRCVFIFLRFEI